MILKYLDVSTRHVTRRDMDLLADAPDAGPIFAHPYPEGAFITGPDLSGDAGDECAAETDAECLRFGYSESFMKVLRYARSNGCAMIRIDADGYDIADLDSHDW